MVGTERVLFIFSQRKQQKRFGCKFMYQIITVIAMGCPTATSFDPSGAKIFAKNLKPTSQYYDKEKEKHMFVEEQ